MHMRAQECLNTSKHCLIMNFYYSTIIMTMPWSVNTGAGLWCAFELLADTEIKPGATGQRIRFKLRLSFQLLEKENIRYVKRYPLWPVQRELGILPRKPYFFGFQWTDPLSASNESSWKKIQGRFRFKQDLMWTRRH